MKVNFDFFLFINSEVELEDTVKLLIPFYSCRSNTLFMKLCRFFPPY